MSLKSRDFKVKAIISVAFLAVFVVAAFAVASQVSADEKSAALADKARELIRQDQQEMLKARIERNQDTAKVIKQLAEIVNKTIK